MKDEAKMRELSRKLAKLAGLTLAHPPAPAGELHDSGGNVLHWYRCTKHETWMQPCFCVGFDFPHWHCKVEDCTHVRAAKFRIELERDIFRLMKYMEQHG